MRLYHWIVLVYVIVCVAALAVIPMSAAGWITPDPLSAIPAVLLGIPWSLLLTSFVESDSPTLNILLLAAAIAINASLIWLLGRLLSRR